VTAAREEILARIRAAIGPAAASAEVDAAYAALPRGYRRAHHDPAGAGIVALFAERAGDYRAVVERVPADGLPAAVARAVAAIPQVASSVGPGAGTPGTADIPRSVLVPEGLPAEWLAELPSGTKLVRDDPPLSPRDLDRVSGVITGCATAIAETGRALTLVPDFHLVVVQAGQVEADIAGALARLDPARPHTLISGPSATSDIELIRVEGVHGPRNLHILIVG